MSMRSQLLKGVLEGCLLAVISNETVYGYELSKKLQDQGLEVSEGSIYPILLRLQKDDLIMERWRSHRADRIENIITSQIKVRKH